MKVYKFTKSTFYKNGTFRLGTLYDYRMEEQYGSSIGDRREGTFDMEYQHPFKTNNKIISNLTKNQKFEWAYSKGEKIDKNITNPYNIKFTSANLLVYSVTMIDDDFLFNEFQDTDCCIQITDFFKFSETMVTKIKTPVEKWIVQPCTYCERTVTNKKWPMPMLPLTKDRKYQNQNEIRLCIQTTGDPSPVVISDLELLSYCKIHKTKQAFNAI